MYSKPKFKRGEIVRFPFDPELGRNTDKKAEGKIGVVDAYGTWDMHDQPYYDIWVGKPDDENRVFVKHVPENVIERIKKE